jgi:hypothetical protein
VREAVGLTGGVLVGLRLAARVAVAGGGGPAVPVGWGVHQNHPTTVPPSLKSSTTGAFPVSSSISSRMRGSTGWKAITGQER